MGREELSHERSLGVTARQKRRYSQDRGATNPNTVPPDGQGGLGQTKESSLTLRMLVRRSLMPSSKSNTSGERKAGEDSVPSKKALNPGHPEARFQQEESLMGGSISNLLRVRACWKRFERRGALVEEIIKGDPR